MAVKIVTDSSADIPEEIAQELDITVIPLYIRFGDKTYRDGVDITLDQLYDKLRYIRDFPKTSIPSPGDIAGVYNRLASDSNEIVSIHLSPRYSGALNAAMLASEYVPEGHTIHVIDSKSVSMGCGLVVMAAARAAQNGADLEEIMRIINRAIECTHIIGMIADIKYLLGGRRLSLPGWHLFLGKLGTLIRFKLVGKISEAGKARGIGMYLSEKKALEKLEQSVSEFGPVEEIAVLHARKQEWADVIASRLAKVFPQRQIHISRLSGATGTHGGPGAVAVAFITNNYNC
jgi:DegV family protein with EDD domain